MLTGIGAVNWGGTEVHRVTERLLESTDILVRYQGGNDIGFMLQKPSGSYQFNLLPHGITHPGTTCVFGDGMVIDLDYLRHEISMMNYFHVSVTPENLKLSSRAAVCLPLHVREDVLAEQFYHKSDRTSSSAGVAYAYGDQLTRTGIRIGDLLRLDQPEVQYRIRGLLAGKNLVMTRIYDQQPLELSETLQWCREQAKFFAPFICDTGDFLEEADRKGKNILFESSSGTLYDVSYGFYPHTACYHTLPEYAPLSSGLPGKVLDHSIGVIHAYSSSSGDGPFPAEKADAAFNERLAAKAAASSLSGSHGDSSKTRTGPFDLVATRYGIRCQHPDTVVLTGLNVLSGFSEIPVITGYQMNGKTTQRLTSLDTGAAIEEAEPITTLLPGWEKTLDACSSYDTLPENAKNYVTFLEDALGVNISLIEGGTEGWLIKPLPAQNESLCKNKGVASFSNIGKRQEGDCL